MKNTWKQLLTALIVLIFVVSVSQKVDAAAKTETAKVTADVLNVREKPASSSKKLGSLKKGERVTVYTKTKSGWSEIQYKKKKAYVSTQYLDFSKPAVTVLKKQYKNKDIQYAQIKGKGKAIEKSVNDVLLKHAKSSYAYQQKIKQKEQDPKSPAYFSGLSFQTQYNKGSQLSILYSDYEYTGGAHGIYNVTAYNFDLKSGKSIKLNQILNTKQKRSKVQEYVYKEIKKDKQGLFYDNLTKKDVVINNNRPFYYTDGSIELLFQVYEISPYAVGNPTIKIPASVYK